MRKLALTILLASFAAAVVFAQHTPPSPATIAQDIVNRYTTLLELNSAQQTQALAIFTTEVTAEFSAQKDERTQREALHTAVINNDSLGIQSASTAIGNDAAASTLARATAEAAFYQILTLPGQQSKYTQLVGRGGGGGWGRGPGGPGR